MITAVSPAELLSNLAQFSGTEAYHRLSPLHGKLVVTDGVKYLADAAGAYWLIDIIASYQIHLGKYPFQVWALTKTKTGGCVVRCTDGNNVRIKSQRVGYTDFPLETISIWVESSGTTLVALLPGEH